MEDRQKKMIQVSDENLEWLKSERDEMKLPSIDDVLTMLKNLREKQKTKVSQK